MVYLLVNFSWYKNMNAQIFKRFLKNNRGAAVIEFFFSAVVLLLLLFFMIDLAFTRGEIGKLDNLSYSMVNLLRERTQLYGKGNETLSPGKLENGEIVYQDVENFRQLAKAMYYGDSHSSKELYIVLRSLQFDKTPPTQPAKLNEAQSEPQGDTSQCTPTTDLATLANIAPRSELDNYCTLPIYQVTVCIPSHSIFKSFIAGNASAGRVLRSSSVAVGR